MQVNDFMNEHYPGLELRPPLFYSWDIGIRFELGVEWEGEYDAPNNPYILGCYKRAIALFEALHSPTEDIFVVMDVDDYDDRKKLSQQLKNFRPYVPKSMLFRLKHQVLPFIFPEDDEVDKYKTHRFTLKCKTSDLKYIPLLKAICNQDLGLKPCISHRVYFININRKTIFHVYDDRGCDVVAASADSIREIYNKFNEWILGYDKASLDEVFN